ncbi:quinoprotein relay system zinc metallohydrolase 2 [Methylomagnum ishizawai]|uniref:Quinoprotein relay system zinc metallohydrolase 2 n=1 Tax=Methylomagnum ishizawai TaxID=1760988 RepID=A0A1Y6CVF7_9GAMM|nr:quinoprotein relay system zinc metallohydrolase 2 [Methylomagnum ishizawai]SMF94276.1 quinoprotein relay system zinc metallohydrolase 2 [Methylomagnum ishizawai]
MKSPLAACVLALLALPLPGNGGPLPEISLREVAPGVYVHQGVHQLPDRHNCGEIANIGFIVGERCVAVVDTGGNPEQGEALKQAVAAATPVPVCYVINTHVHPDHIYGNLAFKKPGVNFVGHYKLEQAMALRAPYYRDLAERELGFKPGPEHFIPPDRPVRDTLELELGGRTLLLTAHPTAHTDSDLSVYDQKTRTLWLADLLFMGHTPVVDGSLNGWLKVIDKLKGIDARLAIPGHGPVSAAWPLALISEERYLRMLQTEIRAALKANKTMEWAMANVGQSARPEWQLFDEFHQRNIATAFAELEWEDE